ncbi:MAG TPA: HAD family acid phosphatase [Ignavibacteriales bacterium]|nr:HAD family acid phosphatase [Ignavibacteriales bacterium]
MNYLNVRGISSLVLAITAAVIAAGCSSAPKLVNLGIAKNEVSYYYDSGEYDKDLLEAVSNAMKDFDKVNVRDSSAIVFDIDETVLSNYPVIKSMDFGYVTDLWNKWILEAKAPAIDEVKDLYNYLAGRKFHIIFISGRTRAQYDATYKNLKEAGYATFDTLIVRPDNMLKAPAENFKSIERIVLTNMGYRIEGCVGDQWSDLKGAYTGIKVKLPNYLYLIN